MVFFKFSEIREQIEPLSGLYEIYTNNGLPLKVGIAKNLRKRLIAHGNSKQSRLKLKRKELGYLLGNVVSKQSILAKHLYFDSELTTKYDLQMEAGRVSFLENKCYVKIQYTTSRDAARAIEKGRESSGKFRYVGRVLQR